MKLLNQISKKSFLLILCVSLAIVQTNILKKTTKVATKQDELQKIWGDLFSKPQGGSCVAASAADLLAQKQNPVPEPDGLNMMGPRKKVNLLDKQQGYGPSAYFFDFIDEIFQSDITKEFQRIYEEVQKLAPDAKDYTDPYPLSLLVSSLTNVATAVPGDTPPDEATQLAKLKSITKGNTQIFNEKAWKAGITAANIFKACKDFQWNFNPLEVNWAKKIVDRYDFDGDGRLNPREFIIMTILHNKNILGTTCKNCYNDIINKKIDPMFQYLDCNKDSKISAEDIWENFQNLSRKTPGKSNIYSCFIKGKQYRTNAINDLFIKNMKSFDGFLNKDEWRAAILLGYWDRHTDLEKIYTDETKTFKQLRWGPSGDTDLVCDRINNANNPPATPPTTASTPTPPTAAKSYYFRRS